MTTYFGTDTTIPSLERRRPSRRRRWHGVVALALAVGVVGGLLSVRGDNGVSSPDAAVVETGFPSQAAQDAWTARLEGLFEAHPAKLLAEGRSAESEDGQIDAGLSEGTGFHD